MSPAEGYNKCFVARCPYFFFPCLAAGADVVARSLVGTGQTDGPRGVG